MNQDPRTWKLIAGTLAILVGIAYTLQSQVVEPALPHIVGGVVLGLVTILSGWQSGPALVLLSGSIVLVGGALALVIVPARTILQERPPAEARGRVIAAQLTLGNAAAVLPLPLGGALGDWLGIRPVMGALALFALGIGAAGVYHGQR